jgi:hypothetical protein
MLDEIENMISELEQVPEFLTNAAKSLEENVKINHSLEEFKALKNIRSCK